MTEIATMTITELAQANRRKADTLWRKAKRIWSGRQWSLYSEITEEEARVLLGGTPAKVPAKRIVVSEPKERSAQPAQKRKRFQWPSFTLAGFLAVAVYGHTALVWFEIIKLFALPGLLAGVVVFALKHAAVTICRKEKFLSLADDALAFAFVLDGLAWYAHYTIFRGDLSARYADQMGQGAFWTALVLGGLMAFGAFIALVFIKKITVNKMWQ